MQNARLPDGNIINAKEYIQGLHKGKIICPYCDAPVIHVMPNDRNPYFKTTGSGKSIHSKNCSEHRELAVYNSLKLIKRYTTKIEDLTDCKEYIWELDLESTDIDKAPRGKVNEISPKHPKKKHEYANEYINTKYAPQKIKTLDLLAKLIKDNSEELDKIIFNYNGCKYFLEDIVIDQNKAYELVSTRQQKSINMSFMERSVP